MVELGPQSWSPREKEALCPGLGPGQAHVLPAILAGMHAMAQPLTGLDARLYLLRAGEAAAEFPGPEMEKKLDAALVDLAELRGTFRLLQELLHLELTEPRAIETLLGSVIDAIEGDAVAAFAGSGITACFEMHDADSGDRIDCERGELPAAMLDPDRTRQALTYVFSLTRELAGWPRLDPDREQEEVRGHLLCDLRLAARSVEFCFQFEPFKEPMPTTGDLSDLALLLLSSLRVALRGQAQVTGFRARPLQITIQLSTVQRAVDAASGSHERCQS